jgi:tetratricopeptide (TPR) repeat protein
LVVQTEIARKVAEALRIELRGTEAARLDARPSLKPDSYLAYLKGRSSLHRETPPAIEEAKRQFELAITLDDRNAAAYSGLADATRAAGWYYSGRPREEWHEAGRRLVTRALELDPGLAEAHASMGLVRWNEPIRDWTGAEREFKLALSLNPSSSVARSWYSAILQDQGRVDEALQQLTLAEVADPLWSLTLGRLGRLLIWLGRLDEAFIKIQKIGELEPAGVLYHSLLAAYYRARSDIDRCLGELEQCEKITPQARWKPIFRAKYFAVAGEKEKSRTILREEGSLPMFPGILGSIIEIYADLGDIDECFRWMEKEHNIMPLQSIRLNPRLEPIRNDPRFPSFLKMVNLA